MAPTSTPECISASAPSRIALEPFVQIRNEFTEIIILHRLGVEAGLEIRN